MLTIAQNNLIGCNVTLYNNFQNINALELNNATLILSSVIHEVYIYGDNQSVNEFWKRVFSGKFKYIAIRDLMIRRSVDRTSDINDLIEHYENKNAKVDDLIGDPIFIEG